LAAEDSDNAQQFASKDEGMTRKTANLLTFRPFRSHDPIVFCGDVFDQNRMPACCHLTNLSDIERHSSKVPLQERPIFP
jgi:hypothetical protein